MAPGRIDRDRVVGVVCARRDLVDAVLVVVGRVRVDELADGRVLLDVARAELELRVGVSFVLLAFKLAS